MLDGAGGDDNIEGLAGDDLLTGGAGADRFIFNGGDDEDVITDFEVGLDALVLNGVTITGTAEFDYTGDLVDDTVLTLSDGGAIILSEVTGITDVSDLF